MGGWEFYDVSPFDESTWERTGSREVLEGSCTYKVKNIDITKDAENPTYKCVSTEKKRGHKLQGGRHPCFFPY